MPEELAAKKNNFCLRFGKTGSAEGACGTRDFRRIFFNRLGETSAKLAAKKNNFCLRF